MARVGLAEVATTRGTVRKAAEAVRALARGNGKSTAASEVDQEDADETWRRMQHLNINHLVVLKDGDIAGVVSNTDLGGEGDADRRRGRSVSDLMSRSVTKADPEMTVAEASDLMRGQSISCLPIFDGDRLVGIITMSDLLDLIGLGPQTSAD